jgi:hypothetical protein
MLLTIATVLGCCQWKQHKSTKINGRTTDLQRDFDATIFSCYRIGVSASTGLRRGVFLADPAGSL